VASNPLGGIRSYLLNNGPYLMDAGYCFTFLSPKGEAFAAFKSDTQFWPRVEWLDVPVRNRRFVLWPSVRRALRTKRFSLIHSQGLRAGVEVAFADLIARVPHVITLHDVIVPQNDVPGRMKWLKKRITGFLTSRADVILPVSHDCAENHLRHFPAWKRGCCRVDAILNGVDVDRLKRVAKSVDRNAMRRELGFDDQVTILGFFGRFMPQKGFFVLLDALRELARRGFADRVRLVATKDPYGYRAEYMRKVERDDLLKRMVRFIEPVPDIATLLPQIDVLIMPSLWEACPLLPMEAMVLGIPVVGSDAIGLREVLQDTPSIAPPSGDAAALAEALIQTVTFPCVEAARRFVLAAQNRFDVCLAGSALVGLYQSLTSRIEPC
jgi:glycosyltransferase involved in cell wall biosynthesis